MNSHININVDGTDLELGEDFELSVEDRNPLWNDDEMFSYPVQIPLDGNRQFVKNIEHVSSDIRPIDLEHRQVSISVDGMPLRNGVAKMTEGEELRDSITMNVEAGEQSLSDLIGDMKCNEITIDDDIKIGEKVGEVTVNLNYTRNVEIQSNPHYLRDSLYCEQSSNTSSVKFTPQALGFSCPAECEQDGAGKATVASEESYPDATLNVPKTTKSFINVSAAYGATDAAGRPAKYANARVCYKHYAKDADGGTSDELVREEDAGKSKEDLYPYWVLDANRQQSGICFYVLYFLDCLFTKTLGMEYDQSALLAIEDMKRLVFFTTKCKYTELPIRTGLSGSQIKDWLESRGCGGKLDVRAPEKVSIAEYTINSNWAVYAPDPEDGMNEILVAVIPSGSRVSAVGESARYLYQQSGDPYEVDGINVYASDITSSLTANINAMYATAENLPAESVSAILESLENLFGIRFRYDYGMKKVTAYLLRDAYRSQQTVRRGAQVLDMVKVSEKVTGVRVCYSNESSSKEQRDNVKNGVKDYDTDYDYIEYPQQRTVTNKTYQQINQNLSATDMNVYIDLTTGNAYRVKIDGDAKDSASMHPVLFEVGALKGVEIGDCSTRYEDYVTELASGFTPIMFNDVNFYNEKKSQLATPKLAAFVDEDMAHEFIGFEIVSLSTANHLDFKCVQVISEKESYDPSKTDDGNSPLQSYDWGNAIAIMRGGGTDATNESYDYNYDGFGNSKWRTVAGEYAMTTDSIDNFGEVYDYNGTASGIGDGERFSLKIRAYKQPDWATEKLCNADVALRGTFDTFMAEHAHFLLNRKKYIIRVEASAAWLADVPNHWRDLYEFDGVRGYINKVSYTLSAQDGVKDAEIEFYAL